MADTTKSVRKSFATWGTELVFRVDSRNVQTFSDFKREPFIVAVPTEGQNSSDRTRSA